MINFDTMAVELKARLGNRTDLDARIIRWINYAYFEILMNPRFAFFELDASTFFVTIAGSDTYNVVPIEVFANFWHILDVRNVTAGHERKLKRSHFSQIDRTVPTSGEPTRYYRFNRNITLDPVPDAVYAITVRYRRRPFELAPGSTFEINTEWEELIVTLAAVKAFTGLKQPEEAMKQKQIMELLMSNRFDVPELEDDDSENTVEVALVPRY